jgi:hypothetical protein
MGYRESVDGSVIDPAVIEHASDKLAQRHKIVEVNRRSIEDRTRVSAFAGGASSTTLPGPAHDPKGKGKDKEKRT